ncbi:MAG: hypothetical protein V8S87_04265 [Oscillospiraceae bacterium]
MTPSIPQSLIFDFALGEGPGNDGDELITGFVAQPARFAAQLECDGVDLLSVMLYVYPHVLEVLLIHSCSPSQSLISEMSFVTVASALPSSSMTPGSGMTGGHARHLLWESRGRRCGQGQGRGCPWR